MALSAAILSIATLFATPALAQDVTTIATVGSARVTTADVDERLAVTGGPRTGETLEEARERVAGELMAELVVERQLARMPQINPQLGAAIARARRQIMLDFFVQTNVERVAPTDEQVDAFIAENPQYFGDRASFWLNQFLVELPEGEARAVYDAALAELSDGPLTPERILAFQRRLMEADLPFQRQTVWRSSEQLPAPLLERLEALHAAGERIEAIETEGVVELLLLLQRVADPADPMAQRPQIAQGIAQQLIAAQRDALIAELAESVRQGAEPTSEAPVAAVPDEAAPAPVAGAATNPLLEPVVPVMEVPRLWRPWMFVVTGGLGLMLPLVLWSGKGITGSLPRGSFWLWPARLVVVSVVLVGLASTAWVTSRLWPLLGAQTFLALSVGGLVMGVLVAAIWGRDQPWSAPNPRSATLRFSGIVAVQGALFVAYVAFRLGWV
jgi:hypothetical protein